MRFNVILASSRQAKDLLHVESLRSGSGVTQALRWEKKLTQRHATAVAYRIGALALDRVGARDQLHHRPVASLNHSRVYCRRHRCSHLQIQAEPHHNRKVRQSRQSHLLEIPLLNHKLQFLSPFLSQITGVCSSLMRSEVAFMWSIHLSPA